MKDVTYFQQIRFRSQLGVVLLLLSAITFAEAQVTYGDPTGAPIPEKLQGLRNVIDVQHFPKHNDPIKEGDTYYWKHSTSILCKEDAITITEYGAFLYYNDQWNLRRSYPLKELDKTFGTKKRQLKQGEPYTWVKNWRTDNRLFGGWAMWYFIGTTSDGEVVCGYETIETTNRLLIQKN